jgi:DNA-binding HxlR family transcriptional regulator
MKKHGEDCPVSKVAALLGDPCSILLVRDLLRGPKRFGELESLQSASTRTLAKKLKMLEQEGLILHRASSSDGAYGTYRVSKKGAAFHKVVDAMSAYGKKYL